jgi:glycosyltransferase involved in cell wall biosynthesis
MSKTVDNWAQELTSLAESVGLIELPYGFYSWLPSKQAHWRCYQLCELTLRARSGDSEAAAFLKSAHHAQAPGPQAPAGAPGVLRVGICSPSLTSPGGAESWIRSLVKLGREGLEVSGVAVTGPDISSQPLLDAADSCPVYLGRDSVARLADASDVLVVWGIKDFEGFLQGRRPPCVAVSHGCGKWTEKILASASTWSSHRAAVSEPAATSFLDDDGPEPAVLWNGVLEARTQFQGGREEAREILGLAPGDVALTFVGRLSWEKRPLDVCRAAKVLGRPYVPVLVGGGWKRKEVHQAAKRICSRVRLVDELDPPGAAYQGADVFFLTSPSEGFSLSLIEAWLAGLPVVATSVGSIPEVERKFGRLTVPVPVGSSPGQLADAVTQARALTGRWRARKARRISRTWLSEEAFLDRWAAYLLGQFARA